MDTTRREWILNLAAVGIVPISLLGAATAQDRTQRTIDIRIRHRTVISPANAIKVTEGELLELRWTSDEQVEVHLHGYDAEFTVKAGTPHSVVIDALTTGRFPITGHGWGTDGHAHAHGALIYFEVHPN
jgi:hypothetical protein